LIFDKIKRISEEKGLSICALEKKANLGNGTIAGWKDKSPTLGKLQAVAAVLDVKVSDIVD
jgi:transcriptional regulator with XRE-family HTH domain